MAKEPRQRRPRRKRIALLILLIILALVCIAVGLVLLDRQAAAPTATDVTKVTPQKTPAPTPKPAVFDKNQYSTTDPSSLWVIVNKQHPLNPVSYAPNDLVTVAGHQVSKRAVPDLTAMISDAAKDGANLTIISSYRSYQYQVSLYNSYVSKDGQSKADEYSARPGFSEHQTGLAIDFGDKAGSCAVDACYANTTEGKWLAANAYKYGFLLRYTAEKQSITGYEAEAWHYRYIGRDLALEMHDQGVTTLEEFFGVSGGESYPSETQPTGASQE